MKKLISTVLCLFILLSCILPAMAATGVPEEVMESTKSVVRILSKYYNGAATGSGFVIKNEPGEVLIATNDHVVEGNPTSISIWVGEDRMVDAQIVFTTSEKDLCVLKVTDTVDMKPLKLSKEEPQHGAAIYVVGYPGAGDILSDTQAHTSESVTITDGIISAIRSFTIEKGGNPVKLLQVNAAINSGNSGGPLFNTEGVVVGVNTYKVNADSQGVFGSVDISELWNLLDQYNIVIPEESEIAETTEAPEIIEEPVEEPQKSSSLFPVVVCVSVALLVLAVILIIRRNKESASQGKPNQKKAHAVTLQSYMEDYHRGLGINGAVSLLLPAAVQLRNLHNDGKLHLQICPENILISADGASLKEPSSQETGRFNSGFAAPEIYRGAGIGMVSDIYSFASVLLYAATGKVPANSLQQEVLEQEFDALKDNVFAVIIRRAMAFSILDRTQSMQELIYGIAVYNVPMQEKQPVKAAAQRVEVTVPVKEETKEMVLPLPEEKREIPKTRKQAAPRKQTGKLLPIAVVLTCVIVALVLLWNPSAKQEYPVQIQSIEPTEINIPMIPKDPVQIQNTEPTVTTAPMTPEEMAYEEAEALLANGETAKAAIAFGKLGDYSDARERSFAAWNKVPNRKTISFDMWNQGPENIVMFHALRKDGTIAVDCRYSETLSDEEIAQYMPSTYKNIVSIHGTIGLRYDGTLSLPGSDFHYYQELMEWSDLVAISVPCNPYDEFFVGLKSDGTVVAVGNNKYGECNVTEWKDIIAIAAGEDCTFGLKSDGTVVATGRNLHGMCEVESWTDIKAISTHDVQTFGLRNDGTVVAIGSNYNGAITRASKLTNIAFIEGMYAFKEDGTSDSFSEEKWNNIVSITYSTEMGGMDIIGLRYDGSFVFSRGNDNSYVRAKAWNDIQLPIISETPITMPVDNASAY